MGEVSLDCLHFHRAGYTMTDLLHRQKLVSALLLLFFVCSGNVIFYSKHVVSEIGHRAAAASQSPDAYDSAPLAALTCPDHGEQDGHHQDGESCCESHSHVSINLQGIELRYAPQSSGPPAIEPSRFIPEVFLDKFIPPQNLA